MVNGQRGIAVHTEPVLVSDVISTGQLDSLQWSLYSGCLQNSESHTRLKLYQVRSCRANTGMPRDCCFTSPFMFNINGEVKKQ